MDLRGIAARFGVLLLLSACLVLGTTATAQACSCAAESISAEVKSADGVFVGATGDLVDGLDVTRYVEVSGVYKGDVSSTVIVSTGQEGSNGDGNSCNYDLPQGKELVFFASGSGVEWDAGLCSSPLPAEPGTLERLAALLGPPRQPSPVRQGELDAAQRTSAGTPWGVWAGAGAGALAGAIALVLWRSRRDT